MKIRPAAALVLLGLTSLAAPSPARSGVSLFNPCGGPEGSRLLCPNLRIGKPTDLHLESRGGREILRATSDVRSRGKGPIELRGERNGRSSMRTRQRIYRVDGSHLDVPSHAALRFTYVGSYFGGGYWKVHQLARFELRRVGPHGELGRAIRTSAKLNYCLRDLERTRPSRRSPRHRHYPACSQDRYADAVVLGTSVGWSDIYPADYDKQWIDVSGLRGCFAYEMTVDPKVLLAESNERDNSARRLVRLPYRGQPGC